MEPGIQTQAIQYIFDTAKPEKEKAEIQKNINQSVANGFVILATPALGSKIYYQMARQVKVPTPKTVLDRLRKK